MELTATAYLAVAAAALLIGLTKGGLSVGGPVLTILLSLAMPTRVAIGVLLPLLILGDGFALWAHWRRWDRALLVRLLPGGVVGVALASLWLRSMSERVLQLALVVVTVLFVVHRLAQPLLAARWTVAGETLRARSGPGLAAGTASGITSTVAHVGGPPIAMYLLATGIPARSYVATLAAFFTVVNWVKVPGYLAAGLVHIGLLVRLAPLAPLVPLGIVIGRWVVVRISQAVFDRLVLGSLLAGAALLVVR